jgi:anaerobic magnesium-protoporphyrin IX monomethyl ester cyclase
MMNKGNTTTKKLNYLLVMPRLVKGIGDGYSFPLGIAYISSSMKNAGFNVSTLNLNHRDGDVFEILKREIEKYGIDVVATGGLSFQYSTVNTVLESAKRAKSEVITIVGGGIISGDPEPAMKALQCADYGVIGEGEITINELCRVLEQGADISVVDGIIYKNDDCHKRTSPRQERENIDTVPWPDYEGFEIETYLRSAPPSISGLNRQNTIFMLASRSCPYDCTFCFHTVGRKYRQRSLDSFFEELHYLVSKYEIDFICLADELFARNIKRVKEFCERIKKYKISWWAQFRVDDITPELLAILKDGGCEVMSFGLESADNRILKSMRKGTTVEQIERTLKLVYDSGISFEGAFIFGDIEETHETAGNTLKWWRDHSEYRITLNLITVYPGTYLYKYAYEKKIIKDKVQFLKDGCPQINVSKLTDKEFSELIKQIMEAPISQTRPLDSVQLKGVDYITGRVAMSGLCVNCGQENSWDNIKLFTMNFLPCKKCGQKYNAPLVSELRQNIDNNISKLLRKYGKIAIWGINYHASDLFKNSAVMHDENIYAIDNSETKRWMDLYGKKIHASEILNSEKIQLVIVAIPVYYTQIATQIEANHKDVVEVIDMCNLVNPDYKISQYDK